MAEAKLRFGVDRRLEDLTGGKAQVQSRVDDALLRAASAALFELEEFAGASPPPPSSWKARVLSMLLLMLRVVFMLFPCGGCCKAQMSRESGFFSALVRLGGIEKAYTLLVVARFDIDQSGTIDEEERCEYEKQGDRLVNNAIAGCQNTSVVATLLIGAAHLSSIGRPVAWAASAEFVESFGAVVADRLLWTAYSFNVLVEVGALALLVYATFARVLLVYVLPSLGARLTYLVDSNLPGILLFSILFLVVCTFCVVGVGGVLASPRWGFLALGFGPLVLGGVAWHTSYYWFQATLVLHRQVRAVCDARRDAKVREYVQKHMESGSSSEEVLDDGVGGVGRALDRSARHPGAAPGVLAWMRGAARHLSRQPPSAASIRKAEGKPPEVELSDEGQRADKRWEKVSLGMIAMMGFHLDDAPPQRAQVV